MSAKHLPSAEYLRQRFIYQDGKLFWRSRAIEHFTNEIRWKAWNTKHAGKEAGYCHERQNKGKVSHRWVINLGQPNLFYRSRLVWAYHYGEWADFIDHENRDELDDRIENLRIASKSQNQANAEKPRHNTSGFKGVVFLEKTKMWRAQIGVNNKHVSLGQFATPEEAHAAYCAAAKKHFGEFACDGGRGSDRPSPR